MPLRGGERDSLRPHDKAMRHSTKSRYDMKTGKHDSSPTAQDYERRLKDLFAPGVHVFLDDERLEIIDNAKPTPQYGGGEPKTDVYVLANVIDDHGDMVTDGQRELKISYKKSNADFLENKVRAERAHELFGDDADSIIMASTKRLRNKFEDRDVLYHKKNPNNPSDPGELMVTLGWRLDFVRSGSGELTENMGLTQEQLHDIYSGANLPEHQRDAQVNGRTVKDSGVANYMLVGEPETAQEAIDMMVPIDDYVKSHPNMYVSYKALNYRATQNKYDGNRALAVRVHWSNVDGRLTPRIDYDEPLHHGGNESYHELMNAMEQLESQSKTPETIINEQLAKNGKNPNA